MITVANRATPKQLTLEQQQDAMTSEGAAPAGQKPEPAPAAGLQPTEPVKQPVKGPPRTSPGA